MAKVVVPAAVNVTEAGVIAESAPVVWSMVY
jgi:hypothetical protein